MYYLKHLFRGYSITAIFFILCTLFQPTHGSAQIYGNTIEEDQPWNLTRNYIVWWRIETGPNDSGSFTHLGAFAIPTNGATEVKAAIYDNNPTLTRPANLLADVIYTPINGQYNTIELTTPVALSPSTTYWIAFRGNLNYATGGTESGNPYPYPYQYMSRNYSQSWPTVTTSLQQGNINRQLALYAIANNVALPVELLSFDVSKQGQKVLLEWETATEVNNHGWNIQKTKNGYTWETIDWVKGAGDTTEKLQYSYIDKSPNNGLNLYRLEQVDFDGTTAYSDVQSAVLDLRKKQITPNPFTNHILLQGYDGNEYSIVNSTGIIIKEGILTADSELNLSVLAPGIYRCIINEGGLLKSHTLVKK